MFLISQPNSQPVLMSSLAIYLGAPAVLLLVMVVFFHLREEKKRSLTKDLPSPGNHLPILGLAPMLIRLAHEGEVFEWLHKQCKLFNYKTWVYYSPESTEFMLSDPRDVKYCFATNFLNYEHTLRRPKFEVITGKGIFTADGEQWKEHRRLAVSMFTSSRLDAMQYVFEARSKTVTTLLAASKQKFIDIQSLMYSYTFDSICEIALGVSSDSMGGDERSLQFQAAFDSCQRIAARRFIKAFWHIEELLAKIGIGNGEETELRRDIKLVNQFIYNIISSRTQEQWDNGKDILCVYKHQKPEVEESELRDVALNFIIAGRDTTAAAATWMLLELSKSTEALERVREEIKTESSVSNMHYLQAVFLETLRLQPSVPMDGKTSINDDTLPSGVFVPAGSNVNFHPWSFTKNPNIFEDPESFKPERWILPDGHCKNPDQYSFPQFNMGPRICLGRIMAANEAKTIISEIVSNFDFSLETGYERKFHHSAVIQSKNGLMLSFTPRAA